MDEIFLKVSKSSTIPSYILNSLAYLQSPWKRMYWLYKCKSQGKKSTTCHAHTHTQTQSKLVITHTDH